MRFRLDVYFAAAILPLRAMRRHDASLDIFIAA